MINNITSFFFPDLDRQQIRKFSYLGAILFLILGSYWLLRLIKNTIVFTVAFAPSLGWGAVDAEYFQTYLKFSSPWLILIIVLIYSKFVGKVKRQNILTTLWGVYAVIFAVIALLFLVRDLNPSIFGKNEMAAIGIVSYLVIESFGALAVVMFWSFTNSITSTENAKRGFPFILTIAHIGAFLFSSTLHLSSIIGLWSLIFFCSIAIVVAIVILKKFVVSVPKESLTSSSKKVISPPKEGFIQGFLGGFLDIIKNPYLIGVMVVSTFYEVISQVIDFQMHRAAKGLFGNELSAGFIHFEANFGMIMNLLTALVSLLGISFALNKFGTRVCLMIFPFATTIIFTVWYFYSNFSPLMKDKKYMLILTASAMILFRVFAYAVNNPTKEIMWIPTTKEIKFRSKGFIDSLAARLFKSKAAGLNQLSIGNQNIAAVYLSCFAIIIIWSITAYAVGKKNKQLVEDNEIIS